MKKFQVRFKDGTDLYVNAHGFKNNMNTGNRFEFYKSEKDTDGDIFVSTNDVLYIVAVPDSDSDTDS